MSKPRLKHIVVDEIFADYLLLNDADVLATIE
jgi:hypothetical protein